MIFRPIFLLIALGASLPAPAEEWQLLGRQMYHLRSGSEVEWAEFAGKTPHGPRLEVSFQAGPVSGPVALFLRQINVKHEWSVELNGRRLGKLQLMEPDLVQGLPVPRERLRAGENLLAVTPPKESDDILVGEIRLAMGTVQTGAVQIRVTEKSSGVVLPCRITIVDRQGSLAPLFASERNAINSNPIPDAVRTGVVYAADGEAKIGLLPGDYTIFAGRGFEFSVATQKVSIAAGRTEWFDLQLRREVETAGWISCDTHVHTLTYSGHGDASLEERLITLAGEGIELPIATDHNYHTDYSAAARKLDLDTCFSPVIGNEVTTQTGHFNIFPIQPGSPPPDFRIKDWPQLMEALRATPSVQMIILNHPRDRHSNFRPFGRENFNPVTAENLRGSDFGFDGLELVNSGALQSDLMQLYRDWFALLNYGYRIVGVGSSDSHDVSRYIVGQARTYIASSDPEAGRLDIHEACRQLRRGRALVSMGLLTQMTAQQKYLPGDLATNLPPSIELTVLVQAPSWSGADLVELYANGEKIRAQKIDLLPGQAQRRQIQWIIPRPRHDLYLVAIATGPGVTAPFWPIPRPYQPSSPVWQPRLISSTNPIWLDADDDGAHTSPRSYAKRIFKQTGPDAARLIPALASFDAAVAAQAASLVQASGRDIRGADFSRILESAPQPVRAGFAAFEQTL